MFLNPKFKFLNLIPNGEKGFNTTFIVAQYFNFFGFEIFESKWVGKISFKLSVTGDPNVKDVPDMDQRSILAYQLANKLGVNVPKIKLVRFNTIKGHDEILNNINILTCNDFTYVPISRYVGNRISDTAIINTDDLLTLFIFDCWIGNLDKKIDDYVIDINNKLWGIDYQLWGPIDNTFKSLGYCGRLYDLNTENLRKYCLPKKLREYLNYNKMLVTNILKKIDNLENNYIKAIVNKYNFYSYNKDPLNDIMVDYLILRKKHIRSDIRDIFNSDC